MTVKVDIKKQEIMSKAMHSAIFGANQGAIVLQNAIIEQLSTKGSGTHYSKRAYRSAGLGRPPVVQTGHLRNSVQLPHAAAHGNGALAQVGITADYAPPLEFEKGKRSHPFIRPTVSDPATLARIIKATIAGFKKAFSGAKS